MPTIVIIAEKPSVGRDIAKALLEKKSAKTGYIEGVIDEQVVISSWVHGHLVELIYPDAYNPDWKRWRYCSRARLSVSRNSTGTFAQN